MIAGYLWNRSFNTLLYIDIIRYNIIYRLDNYNNIIIIQNNYITNIYTNIADDINYITAL